MEIKYESATFWRYFSARFTDLFLAALLFLILTPALVKLIPIFPNYAEANSYTLTVKKESHLYVEDNLIKLTSYVEELDKTINEKSAILNENIAYFYDTYLPSVGINLNRFKDKKSEAKVNNQKMFDESGNRTLTNIDYDKDYYTFYCSFYEKEAIGDITYVPDYAYCRRVMIVTRWVTYALTFVINYLIFILIIPLIFYKGYRSIGMILNKLILVDSSGFTISYKRYLLRFLFELFIIFLGSFAALFIPLAISFSFIVVREDNQSLTDYVCGTYMVKKEDTNYRTRKDYINSVNS